MRTRLLALLALLIALMPMGTAADDDQERARQAVVAGRILPLTAIIERATARFGGTVLDAEYEDEDDDDDDAGEQGGPSPRRYRLKLLTTDGRILKLGYDAVSGELVSRRGHRPEHPHGGRQGGEDD